MGLLDRLKAAIRRVRVRNNRLNRRGKAAERRRKGGEGWRVNAQRRGLEYARRHPRRRYTCIPIAMNGRKPAVLVGRLAG